RTWAAYPAAAPHSSRPRPPSTPTYSGRGYRRRPPARLGRWHIGPVLAGPTAHRPKRPLAGEPVRGSRARVVVDVLFLLVLLQPGGAELAADTRLAEAAPLGLRQVGVVVVDPHRAVAERAGHPFGLTGVRRPHRPGQPVRRVVAEPDGLLLGAEPLHRHHRAEHFLLHPPHLPTPPPHPP